MTEITNGVYYTGVQNPSLRVFDVTMKTEYGTTYNSYLVKGTEKVAAIEAAHLSFFDYYQDELEKALDGESIDYLVLNHCEPDHTGCISKLLQKYPDITIVVSQAGAIYIKQIINNLAVKIQVVKDGETINLGGKTLKFINAPFLHWPDSMFTYLPEDNILFSCDFLGAHFCEPQVYDTKTVYPDQYWNALKYYYDCIFGPFQQYVAAGLEKIKGLSIDYACTSHGPILTKRGNLSEVLRRYTKWSTPLMGENRRIPIFYVSAYGNTRQLAAAISKGIRKVFPDGQVELYDIIEHDIHQLAEIMNESDAFLVGSPTINRDAVAPIWQLLAGIEAITIQKRPVAVFGSYGWSGEAIPHIAQRLESVKAKLFENQFKINFVPTPQNIDEACAFGEAFANFCKK